MWSSNDADCEQLERACSDDCDAVRDVTADTAVQSAASSVSSWSIPSAPPSPCPSQIDSDVPECQQRSLPADAEDAAEHGDVATTSEAVAASTTGTVAASAASEDAATTTRALTAIAAPEATTVAAATLVAPTAADQRCQQQHCASESQQLHSPKRCMSPMRSVSLSWACAWTTTTVEPEHTADVLPQPHRSQP
jgi:hypothetical protein